MKIDGSFIHNVKNNRGDAAITVTIAVMTKSLHLGVLAEGFETREQARFLKTIGCHDMQGILFGEPVPVERFGTQLGDLDVFMLAGFERPSGNTGAGDPAAA